MLSRQGFDLWAGDYDRTVQVSEESDRYPFAGYKQILNTIYNELMQESHSDILDIGFGTGVLTTQLYQAGHQIDGIDFSPEMIRLAREKLPEANLIEFDIHEGLPEAIQSKHYDAIVSSYTLHHLTDMEKVEFIQLLLARLKTGGRIYIGDIAFSDRAKLEACRQDNIAHWDEEEYYFVADEFVELVHSFCQIEFHQISHCGAVFIICSL